MPEGCDKVQVLGIVFQNNFGVRFYSKYFLTHCKTRLDFDLKSEKEQRVFQTRLREKVDRMKIVAKMTPVSTEIFSIGNLTILFKVFNELQIYLVCEQHENLFLMENVIDCLGRVLQLGHPGQFAGKLIYDHLDTLVLAVDQIIDEGLIVCIDPIVVHDRLKMRDPSDPNAKIQTKPILPQPTTSTFSSLFNYAKNSIQKTLNIG